MTTPMLWRLEGVTTATVLPREKLTSGLRLHLAHSALWSVLLQIGEQQRAYVVLPRCTGCASGRCAPGCRRDLFARMLGGAAPAGRLLPVAGGLAARPYTRFVAAIPQADARPLTATLLQAWKDARLTLCWRGQGEALQVGALLAVGADGPEPRNALAAEGWTPRRALWLARNATASIPAAKRPRSAWTDAPFLLLPCADASDVDKQNKTPGDGASGPDDAREAIAARLLVQLTSLVQHEADDHAVQARGDPLAHVVQELMVEGGCNAAIPTVLAEEHTRAEEAAEPQSLWPCGPGRMRPADVAWLIEQLRTSPIVHGGDEPGITRRRVAALLPDTLSAYSRQCVYWLHTANVLTPPPVSDEPFRNPRALQDMSDAALAAALHATPIPAPELARAAMQKGERS